MKTPSSMTSRNPKSQRTAPSVEKSLAILALFILGIVAIGSFISVLGVQYLAEDSSLLYKGEAKFARRVMMICALLFAPLLFLWFRIQWPADASWKPAEGYKPNKPWWNFFLQGLVLGLFTMGILLALSLVMGTRFVDIDKRGWDLALRFFTYGAGACFIAVFEETLSRGFLFRAIGRRVGIWTAIILTSALFAGAHFLTPSDLAFQTQGSLAERTLSVFSSCFTTGPKESQKILYFLNLSMMGILLCLLTLRTGTIWMAAGTHAGWVWVKKMNSILADRTSKADAETLIERRLDPGHFEWLIGGRSDHADSLVTLLLLSVLAYAVYQSIRQSQQNQGGKEDGNRVFPI